MSEETKQASKHFFVEDFVVREVPEEFALGRVAAGDWYLCDHAHTIHERKLDIETGNVYHKNTVKMGRQASKDLVKE